MGRSLAPPSLNGRVYAAVGTLAFNDNAERSGSEHTHDCSSWYLVHVVVSSE